MINRIFMQIVAWFKKQKVILIPLGTLLILATVLGGLLIDSAFPAFVSAIIGTAIACSIFICNKKLFVYVSDCSKKAIKNPRLCFILYFLLLLIFCGGILFLIGIYRFDVLLLTGVVLVLQLFSLSFSEAVHSIKNG